MYRKYFKRLVDILGSLFTLSLLSPLFVLIAVAIKINSKGPVFFTQKRVGLNKREFKIFKFRTMLTLENSYYKDGSPIENYDRITSVGRILRKTSLDEIPQIINILIGEMSIIGPRPTLLYQVEKYNSNQMKRLEVKPGLTGLAQVNGRNSLSWEEKINYDLKYVNNISFIGDTIIVLKTILVLFKSDTVEFKAHDEISKHAGDVRDDI